MDVTPVHQTIVEIFEAQAADTPQAIAVVFENQHLTYNELNVQANELAYSLRALGIGPETLVAICTERSVELIVGMMGILKSGALPTMSANWAIVGN